MWLRLLSKGCGHTLYIPKMLVVIWYDLIESIPRMGLKECHLNWKQVAVVHLFNQLFNPPRNDALCH